MDPITIQQLATEVANRFPTYPLWLFLSAQLLLTAFVAAGAAFSGGYFRTRGQNLATKADFETLKEQLRATTEMVENIKADVSRKEWIQRETTTLLRMKLEELLDSMHDCETYLERYRAAALNSQVLQEPDPQSKLKTIAALYFPEFSPIVQKHSSSYRQQISLATNLALKLAIAGPDNDARQAAYDQYGAEIPKFEKQRLDAEYEMRATARAYLAQKMGLLKTYSQTAPQP